MGCADHSEVEVPRVAQLEMAGAADARLASTASAAASSKKCECVRDSPGASPDPSFRCARQRSERFPPSSERPHGEGGAPAQGPPSQLEVSCADLSSVTAVTSPNNAASFLEWLEARDEATGTSFISVNGVSSRTTSGFLAWLEARDQATGCTGTEAAGDSAPMVLYWV